MAAFLATAWFTMIISAVPAFFDLYQRTHESFGSATKSTEITTPPNPTNTSQNPPAAKGEHERPEFVNKFERLLGPLCDLQTVTGLAIVIAGLITHDTISFYHEQLVMNYWYITLNSFWASRAEFMDQGTDGEKIVNELKKDKNGDLRVIARRLSILASCILGASFQVWVNMREWKARAWDNEQSGHCYNFRDGSSNWPWVVGLLLFCLALLLTLFKTTRGWVKEYLQVMDDVKNWFVDTTVPKKYRSFKAARSKANNGTSIYSSTSTTTRSHRLAICVQGNFLLLQVARFVFVLFWLSQVWLSVWAYGTTPDRLTWSIYLGFCIWNSFDIISLQRMNRQLLGDDELQWGYGQLLPLVMLLAIVYSVFDAFWDDSE